MEIVRQVFSWFAESLDCSVLDIRSVWVDLFIISCFSASFSAIVLKLLGDILHRTYSFELGLIIGGCIAALVEYILIDLPNCLIRLMEILENAEFIFGYESNRRILFSALNIEDIEENANRIGKIIYYLSDSEWDRVIMHSGDMELYMRHYKSSMIQTIGFMGKHVGVPIPMQDISAYLPIIILLGFALFMAYQKRWHAVGIIVAFTFCYVPMNYGTSLYYVFFLIWYLPLYLFLCSFRHIFTKE